MDRGLVNEVFTTVTSGKEGIAKGLYVEGVMDAIIVAWCTDREVDTAAAEGVLTTAELSIAEGPDCDFPNGNTDIYPPFPSSPLTEGVCAHAGLPTAGGIVSKPLPLQPAAGTRGADDGLHGSGGEATGMTPPWSRECEDHGAGQADFPNLFIAALSCTTAVGAAG